jgi:hypothetical protein
MSISYQVQALFQMGQPQEAASMARTENVGHPVASHYLAASLDWQGILPHEVERYYRQAFEQLETIDPRIRPSWHMRWLNFLTTRARREEWREWWDQYIAPLDTESDDILVYTHLYPAAYLNRRVRLDDAKRVLSAIPSCSHPLYRSIYDEWQHLRQVQRQRKVFPGFVTFETRWEEAPHLFEGDSIENWWAGRIEYADDEAVCLHIGRRNDGPEYGSLDVPYNKFQSWVKGECPSSLADRYVELAEPNGVPEVRFHPDRDYVRAHYPLEPDPNRYLPIFG